MEKLHGTKCPQCHGSGREISYLENNIGIEVDCSLCGGTKLINITNACQACQGKGNVIIQKFGLYFEVKCDKCSGSGVKS